MRTRIAVLAAGLAAAAGAVPAEGIEVTLRGSPESMQRQHAVAVHRSLPFVQTREEMEGLARDGGLVPLAGAHYGIAGWVNTFALPEVRLFVERLATEYTAACGDTLVVTSLTRPRNAQPSNAHARSVHPAGMAVDLRIPRDPACREWIEEAFLELEEAGVIDATLEARPPHYHVAVFPEAYARFVAALTREDGADGAVVHEAGLPPGEAAATGGAPGPLGGTVPALGVAAAIAVALVLGASLTRRG